MFAAALRRQGANVMAQSKRGITFSNKESRDAKMIAWAETSITPEMQAVNPIKKEPFITALAVATAAYVAYAYSRPLKDTHMWDINGDLRVPVLTPALDWIGDKFGQQTTHGGVVADPFEDFTDEEKIQRVRQLDAGGYFDRFLMQHGDDCDKLRLLRATTERALIHRLRLAAAKPHTAFTRAEIEHAANLQRTTKQPVLKYPLEDGVYEVIDTAMDRNAIAFDLAFNSPFQGATTFAANAEAYNKAMGL